VEPRWFYLFMRSGTRNSDSPAAELVAQGPVACQAGRDSEHAEAAAAVGQGRGPRPVMVSAWGGHRALAIRKDLTSSWK
jgi:hypothetical protein